MPQIGLGRPSKRNDGRKDTSQKKPPVVRPAVILRLEDGEVLASFERSKRLEDIALKWSYVVRNRKRWNAIPRARVALDERARADLASLGVQEEQLARARGHSVLEVSILAGDDDWVVRTLPWEALVSRATAQARRGDPQLIVRHLDTGTKRAAAVDTPHKLLFVESSPQSFANLYDYRSERMLVVQGSDLPQHEHLLSPTIEELERTVRSFSPEVVHLAGMDAREAVAESGRRRKNGDAPVRRRIDDGYVLKSRGFDPFDVAKPEHLAQVLCAGAAPPRLVACNFYNSAVKVAAELARAGVGTAIGFRDEMDNGAAETFFADFYRACRGFHWDLLRALRWAWTRLFETRLSLLIGSGLVVWSSRSLFDLPAKREPRPGVVASQRTTENALTTENEQTIETSTLSQEALSQLVEVRIKPRKHINYSVLHNGRGLFEEFRLKKVRPGRLHNVHVEVLLHNGTDSFAYRRTLVFEAPDEDLSGIQAPLTSPLGRSLREAVRTSLFIEVRIGSRVIFRDTPQVTLLAPDEWRDDDSDGPWLPSFVLPRDPEVAKLIDHAQKYLVALSDNLHAGFDGYQRRDQGRGLAHTPVNRQRLKGASDPVEEQVRAIWYAVAHEKPVAYVNPPPTFTDSRSQRLRTPTDIMRGGRGTCIDLALLLAACIEYVGIHPVLFLATGHAYVGYWASDAAHEGFIGTHVDARRLHEVRLDAWTSQQIPWQIVRDSAQLAELHENVESGALVPLEATSLAAQHSFDGARKLGRKNFEDITQFEAMLDIQAARSEGVTPLPVGG
jgi:hypothetical protein